jgi:two-component system phosphate regulon response regulator PhoB
MDQTPAPTILIVEDDMLFQSIYKTRLQEAGYVVKAVSDGRQALVEIETSPPDLVLLDLVLPLVNGYEVLAHARANPQSADLPIIILSNKGEPGDIERAMAAGATDYLVKTVAHPKEVVWKISQAVALRTGASMAVRIAIREKELDAQVLAKLSGQRPDLRCDKCSEILVLELSPLPGRPGWFESRLVCARCAG